MSIATATEWRSADLEGKTWCVLRWINNSSVEYIMSASGKTKRFRSRAAATNAAERLNLAA
jgi:hypothetical protein